MKRQKRDFEQRAFNKGYQAGVTGKSKSACPNGGKAFSNNGYPAGDQEEDNWDGFTGVSGIHKMPGIST